MNTIKNLERLQKLHELIEVEVTGTPMEIAQRMKVSERTVYYLLDQLKDFEAEIGYDRGRKTYFYKNDFVLQIQFSVQVGVADATTNYLTGSYLSKF